MATVAIHYNFEGIVSSCMNHTENPQKFWQVRSLHACVYIATTKFTSSPTVQQCVKNMQSKLFLSLVLQERKQEKKNSTIIVALPIETKRNNGGESSGSNFFLSLRLVVKSLLYLSFTSSLELVKQPVFLLFRATTFSARKQKQRQQKEKQKQNSSPYLRQKNMLRNPQEKTRDVVRS